MRVWGVGVGSVLFHATMRYHTELLDELPMVAFIASTAFTFHRAHPYFTAPTRAAALVQVVLGVNTVAVVIYLLTRIL